QRADVGFGLEAAALLHRLYALRQRVDERVVHLLLDEEPRAGAAHLSLIEEHPADRALRGRLHIGVAEDDVRRLAAELERHPLQRRGRLALDLLADLGRAREGD